MASLCRSTVVHGTEGLEDLKEKKEILNNITRLNAGTVHEFSDAMVRHVNVLKVEVTEFTCKSGVMYQK